MNGMTTLLPLTCTVRKPRGANIPEPAAVFVCPDALNVPVKFQSLPTVILLSPVSAPSIALTAFILLATTESAFLTPAPTTMLSFGWC